VWLEGLGKLKKSTSSEFDPATFRLYLGSKGQPARKAYNLTTIYE
jgi:hypothetical protein